VRGSRARTALIYRTAGYGTVRRLSGQMTVGRTNGVIAAMDAMYVRRASHIHVSARHGIPLAISNMRITQIRCV
jgi:hypothetical protein